MIKVNILYGSSCVGKSTIMNNDNNKYTFVIDETETDYSKLSTELLIDLRGTNIICRICR